MRILRLILTVGALVALTGALVACGDDDSNATTATTTESVSSPTTPDETTTTTSTTDDGATPPADREVEKLTGFSSPSGNIGCVIDRRSVRCDIGDRDWEPPRAPRSCELDYGQGISLAAGAAPELVCAGDTTLNAGEALPYGQSIAAGLLRCESEESGISCRDTETGRGFTISKQAYELF